MTNRKVSDPMVSHWVSVVVELQKSRPASFRCALPKIRYRDVCTVKSSNLESRLHFLRVTKVCFCLRNLSSPYQERLPIPGLVRSRLLGNVKCESKHSSASHQELNETNTTLRPTTSTANSSHTRKMSTLFEPSLSTSAMRPPLSSADAPSIADSLPNINFGFDELRDRMAKFTVKFDTFIEQGRKRVLEERNQFRMNVAELKGKESHTALEREI